MAEWFRRKTDKISTTSKKDIKEGMWTKCSNCGEPGHFIKECIQLKVSKFLDACRAFFSLLKVTKSGRNDTFLDKKRLESKKCQKIGQKKCQKSVQKIVIQKKCRHKKVEKKSQLKSSCEKNCNQRIY